MPTRQPHLHPARRPRRPQTRRSSGHWSVTAGLLIGLMACLADTSTARAAIAEVTPERQDQLLAVERWSEQAFGISLRPPLGATMHQATADDALLRMAGSEGYSIEVYLRKVEADEQFLKMNDGDATARSGVIRNPQQGAPASQVNLTIDTVMAMAVQQVKVAHPSAVLIDRDAAPLADHNASTVYFRIKDPGSGDPFILSHAYVLVSHDSFVMVRSLMDARRFDQVRPVLEAMLASIRIEDPEQRDARRRAEIDAGRSAIARIDGSQLAASLDAEQWYRLIKGNRDIGHLKITRQRDKKVGYVGLTVTVQAHAELGGQSVDSFSEMFLSNDGEHEIWSTKTTARPRGAAPGGVPQDMTTVETGVRSGNRITVTRDDRGQKKNFEWQTPTEGYLSQAELYLLPPLLPQLLRDGATPKPAGRAAGRATGHDGSSTLGFYAYYTSAGQITYRTMTVATDSRGGTQVTIQPSPNSPFETLIFDVDGQLVERQLPNNQRIVPSTRKQILAIGGVR